MPNMLLQNRDGIILSALYNHDGTLTLRHLKDLFWPNSSLRAAQKRLAILANNGYLARPTTNQRRTQPIPEPVYWLGWRGILWIADHNGVTVPVPRNQRENQMRELAKQLRKGGLQWLREPRWHQLSHDLSVIEIQLMIEKTIHLQASLSLDVWHHESVFRSDGDLVHYKYPDRNGTVRKVKRLIYPDSYFVIEKHHSDDNQKKRYRFLLELDNATHSNSRFGREKVAPGIAYIKSREYKARFGTNSGTWLVVTTGETRKQHLIKQTQLVGKTQSRVFLFTTFNQIKKCNVLLSPIWYRVGQRKPLSLFFEDTAW